MKVSKTGYKKNSKDKNEPALLIPSNKITMKGVKFPVFGISDTGDAKMMYPGLDYSFGGNYVYELPMAEEGYTVPGRYRNPEGNWVSVYANGGDISIPDLSRPAWLDKYQDGSEVTYVTDPNDPRLKDYQTRMNLYRYSQIPNYWLRDDVYDINTILSGDYNTQDILKHYNNSPLELIQRTTNELVGPYGSAAEKVDIPKNKLQSFVNDPRLRWSADLAYPWYKSESRVNNPDDADEQLIRQTMKNYPPDSYQGMITYTAYPFDKRTARTPNAPYGSKNYWTSPNTQFIEDNINRDALRQVYPLLNNEKIDEVVASSRALPNYTTNVFNPNTGHYYSTYGQDNTDLGSWFNPNEDNAMPVVDGIFPGSYPVNVNRGQMKTRGYLDEDIIENIYKEGEYFPVWNKPTNSVYYKMTPKDAGLLPSISPGLKKSTTTLLPDKKIIQAKNTEYDRNTRSYSKAVQEANPGLGTHEYAREVRIGTDRYPVTHSNDKSYGEFEVDGKKQYIRYRKNEDEAGGGYTPIISESIPETPKPKVIPAPTFKSGGWLDKYQDGKQVPANLPWINQQGQYKDPTGVGPTVAKAEELKQKKVAEAARKSPSSSNKLPSGAITPVMGPVEYTLMAPVAASSIMKAAPIIGSAMNVPIAGLPGVTAGNALAAGFAADAAVNRLPQIPGQVSRGEYTDAAINAATGLLDVGSAGMLSPLYNTAAKVIKYPHTPSKSGVIGNMMPDMADDAYRGSFFDPSELSAINSQIKQGNTWLQDWFKSPATAKRIASTGFDESPLVRKNINDFISNKNTVRFDPSLSSKMWTGNELGVYSPKLNKAYVDAEHFSFMDGTKSIPSTVVHEGTHLTSAGDLAYNQKLTDLTNDIFKGSDAREFAKMFYTEDDINKLNKLISPPETHARIMQLRQQYGIKPEQIVDDNTINKIIEDGLSGKSLVSKKFFELIENKDAFKKAMNTLPAIGAGVAIGAGGLQEKKTGGSTGWLRKYQGDTGGSSVRRDPNQPFFESQTEPGLYESQYSQPEVTITPNWTEAELERNRLRDKYIADDKKVWRHWHDKLGYDKNNVTKRANQFAYNKLAKQYLKGDKESLTPEQRKFIEKSEYADRLQPSIGSRFAEGITNPGFNLETLGNLAAPFEYPANLVRGAVKGEFTDALKGQTPSPYFVSSDLAGTSPAEAAIMSGLMDFGVDAGLGALGEISSLRKGIKGVKAARMSAPKELSEYSAGKNYPKTSWDIEPTDDPYKYFQDFQEKKTDIFQNLRSPEGRKRLQALLDNNPHLTSDGKYATVDDLINQFETTGFTTRKPYFRSMNEYDRGSWMENQLKEAIEKGEVHPDIISKIKAVEKLKARQLSPGDLEKTLDDFPEYVEDFAGLVLDKEGNPMMFPVEPKSGFNWYWNGYDKPSVISIGKDWSPYDAPHILEHEWQHVFQKGKPLIGIDDELKKLDVLSNSDLQKKYEVAVGPKRNILQKAFGIYPNTGKPDLGHSAASVMKDRMGSKDYFLEGSSGQESAAMTSEIRENLFQRGIIKNRYDKITPKMIKNHYNLYRNTDTFNRYPIRVYDIMKDKNKNFNLLSNVLNKMPATIPAIGAGYLGYEGMQEKKHGGWLNKYGNGGPGIDLKNINQIVANFQNAQHETQGTKYKDALNWHQGWMNSPMYNEMLYTGENRGESQEELAQKDLRRKNNLQNLRNTPLFIDYEEENPFTAGYYDPNFKQVAITPKGFNDPTTITHEVRHGVDDEYDFNFTKKDISFNMPKEDLRYLKKNQPGSYRRTKKQLRESDQYFPFYNEDWRDKDSWENNKDYFTNPSEVNARLSEIRRLSQEQGAYDPFTQKVPDDFFNKVNIDALEELQRYYPNDKIKHMLNTFSYNDTQNNPTGIYQSRYGGWLNKYQDGSQVPKSWKDKYDWTPNVEEEYQQFKNDPNAPENLKFTDDMKDYNTRGMWDSLDRPSNWQQALDLFKQQQGYDWTPEEDGYYHAWSQHPGTGEWLKPKHHSTGWMNYMGYAFDPKNTVVVNPEGFFGNETLQAYPKQKKKGGVKSSAEGYYDYINGYSGIFANGGRKGWLDNYK
jgi:hypothetical protein